MEPLAHIEILKHILPILNNKDAEEIIQKLEVGLASGAEWCHDRIQFLKQSDPHAWDVAADCHEARVYRITIPKMRQIAHRGLVQAWRDGIISTIEIGAFADDIASLQGFSHTLVEVEFEGHLAPVWAHAFDLPPGLSEIRVDLEKIYREEKERQKKKS